MAPPKMIVHLILMILGNIGPRTGLFGIVHVPRPELNSKLFVGAPVYLRDATFG